MSEPNERDWERGKQIHAAVKGTPYRLRQVEPIAQALADTRAPLEQELAAVREERDAYKRAKAENDARFLRERDEAREERDEARAILSKCWEAAGLLGPNMTGNAAQAWEYGDDLVQQIYDLSGRAGEEGDRDALEAENGRLEAEVERLKEALDAADCTLDDEEVSGVESVELLKRAEAENTTLRARLAEVERERDAITALCYRHVSASEGDFWRIVLDTFDRQAKSYDTKAEAIAAVRRAAGLDGEKGEG